MILDKVLLLKGLGGLTACAGLGCGATYLINPDLFRTNDQILAELISKVGLTTCTVAAPECSIEDSGLNIKQGDEKAEKKTKQNPSSGTEGKIKVYANNTDYNKGFKFVIEDGDITLGSDSSKKLEQFETYEIKEDGDKWYLTRKTKAIDEKKKLLGLPADESCALPTSENGTATCSGITAEKLKAINFEGKGSGGASITEGGTISLTITKVPNSESEFSTEGYKFSFNPTEEVTISTSSSIKIMKNTNTEFKIKKTENKLSLEKAWTADALAKKAGLTGCDSGTKECTLPTSDALKLYISSSSDGKVTNGKVEESKKIKYEENAADHNQGFKFFTESEITLANGNSSKKIEASTAATYEIVKNTTDSNWYLTKKAVTNEGAGS